MDELRSQHSCNASCTLHSKLRTSTAAASDSCASKLQRMQSYNASHRSFPFPSFPPSLLHFLAASLPASLPSSPSFLLLRFPPPSSRPSLPSAAQRATALPHQRAALFCCHATGTAAAHPARPGSALQRTQLAMQRCSAPRSHCTPASAVQCVCRSWAVAKANTAFKTNHLAQLVLLRHSHCSSGTATVVVAQLIVQQHCMCVAAAKRLQCCSGAACVAAAQPVLQLHNMCCSGIACVAAAQPVLQRHCLCCSGTVWGTACVAAAQPV